MTDHVFVLHVWDGTNESEGDVSVYEGSNLGKLRALSAAWSALDGIDDEAIDYGMGESMKENGYIMHAMYGPNDALVSVRKMVVR